MKPSTTSLISTLLPTSTLATTTAPSDLSTTSIMNEELRAALSAQQQERQLDVLQRQELQMMRERVLQDAMIRHEISSLQRQQSSSSVDSTRLPAALEAAFSSTVGPQDQKKAAQGPEGVATLEEALLVENLLRRKRTLEDLTAGARLGDLGASMTAANTAPNLLEQAASQALLLQHLQAEQQKQQAVRPPNSILRLPQSTAFSRQLLQPCFSTVAERNASGVVAAEGKTVSFHDDVKKQQAQVPVVPFAATKQASSSQVPFKKRKICKISTVGNSFPLPPLLESQRKSDAITIGADTKLISYQRLWGKLGSGRNVDSKFQQELFRRKLANGSVTLTGRTRSAIVMRRREMESMR